MRHLNPLNTAYYVGIAFALFHAAWATLVATGAAKPLMEFFLELHFVKGGYEVAPFDIDTAALLVVVTYAIGAVLGATFALGWNWLCGRTSERKMRGLISGHSS